MLFLRFLFFAISATFVAVAVGLVIYDRVSRIRTWSVAAFGRASV